MAILKFVVFFQNCHKTVKITLKKRNFRGKIEKVHKNLFEQKIEPKQKSINNILSYASSIKGVKMNSGENILISLN